MSGWSLDSPGAQLAHWQYLSRRLAADTDVLLTAYLAGLRADALAYGWLSPAETSTRWADAVTELLAAATYLDDEHTAAMAPVLLADPIPDVAWLTVRDALAGTLPSQLAARLDEMLAPSGALTAAVLPAMPADEPTAAGRRSPPTWRSRLRRTVTTAVTRTVGEVALARLSVTGYSAKRWVTRRDAAVRPTHAAADGSTAELYGSFEVGRSLLRYPGDPSGSLGETMNCRCVMVGVS